MKIPAWTSISRLSIKSAYPFAARASRITDFIDATVLRSGSSFLALTSASNARFRRRGDFDGQDLGRLSWLWRLNSLGDKAWTHQTRRHVAPVAEVIREDPGVAWC